MAGILVDSCVLLDLFTEDPVWADWSEATLAEYSKTNHARHTTLADDAALIRPTDWNEGILR